MLAEEYLGSASDAPVAGIQSEGCGSNSPSSAAMCSDVGTRHMLGSLAFAVGDDMAVPVIFRAKASGSVVNEMCDGVSSPSSTF